MDLHENDPLTLPAVVEDEDDSSLQVQQVILAAAHHDLPTLRALLRQSSASVQDPETLMTPLHAAIAGAGEGVVSNGHSGLADTTNGDAVQALSDIEDSTLETPAEKSVKLLFQNGAIWNDVDANDETPACLAWRLGLRDLYEICVDAGVRAELLLGRLDGYEELNDDEDEEPPQEVEFINEKENKDTKEDARPPQEDQMIDETERVEGLEIVIDNNEYLKAPLHFSAARLLDADNNAVMMDWERDVMRRSAEILLPERGLRVLNIGHGMGIVDDYMQKQVPVTHHIVEAHKDVLERLRGSGGWLERHHGVEESGDTANSSIEPGVVLHAGRWQDIVPALIQQGLQFDAIYFDTFAESYAAFRDFFTEHLINLLKPTGRFSFFHGLGADRRVCYDVYTRIVEIDLFEAGFDVEWDNINIKDLKSEGEWEGVKRAYWNIDTYRLPLCTFVS